MQFSQKEYTANINRFNIEYHAKYQVQTCLPKC